MNRKLPSPDHWPYILPRQKGAGSKTTIFSLFLSSPSHNRHKKTQGRLSPPLHCFKKFCAFQRNYKTETVRFSNPVNRQICPALWATADLNCNEYIGLKLCCQGLFWFFLSLLIESFLQRRRLFCDEHRACSQDTYFRQKLKQNNLCSLLLVLPQLQFRFFLFN